MNARQGPAGRSPTRLLWDRVFGPFFWGKLLSAFGMWVQNITAAVVIFEITESTLLVATVSIVQFSGPLLLSMYAGSLSDRMDRRKLLLLARTCSTAGAAWLSGIVFLADPREGPPLALFYGGLVVLALGIAMSSPALNALVPALIPPEDLDQALALSSITGSLARAVGPAVGGVVTVAFGPAFSFALAALLHGSFVIGLLCIRQLQAQPRQKASEAGVWEGLRYAIAERNIVMMLVGVAALGVGIDPMITLAPELSQLLVGSSALVGAFASAFGFGAILGIALLRRVRIRHGLRLAGVSGFASLGSGLALSALSANTFVVLVGFTISGLGFLLGQTALSTRIHRRAPDQLRGRIMALWSVAFLGFRPIGATINGALADLFSVRYALLASACIALAAIPFARYSHAKA